MKTQKKTGQLAGFFVITPLDNPKIVLLLIR